MQIYFKLNLTNSQSISWIIKITCRKIINSRLLFWSIFNNKKLISALNFYLLRLETHQTGQQAQKTHTQKSRKWNTISAIWIFSCGSAWSSAIAWARRRGSGRGPWARRCVHLLIGRGRLVFESSYFTLFYW